MNHQLPYYNPPQTTTTAVELTPDELTELLQILFSDTDSSKSMTMDQAEDIIVGLLLKTFDIAEENKIEITFSDILKFIKDELKSQKLLKVKITP